MTPSFSVLVLSDRLEPGAAIGISESLAESGARQVLLSGLTSPHGLSGKAVALAASEPGDAFREALPRIESDRVVVWEPPARAPGTLDCGLLESVLAPIARDGVDAVYASTRGGRSPAEGWATGVARKLAAFAAEAHVDPFAPVRAFRTSVLRELGLQRGGAEVDAEVLVKLVAGAYRIAEIELELPPGIPWTRRIRRTPAFVRYATVLNAQDNLHEGYNTLARMEEAPRYNAWIGRKLRAHLGPRVLEVGAGLGTITREIEAGRELVIALDVDRFYHQRLTNLFRDKPHVEPLHSDVAHTDWAAIGRRGIDSVVLSNVLEHIEDDGAALRDFRKVLRPGGNLVLLVPALPWLLGSMDEAVGHFRRYTPKGLSETLAREGFTVERLEWMNLLGIPGWFLNGRLLRRRAVPPLQLRLYDRLAPWLAAAEAKAHPPIGMSLFAVARAGPSTEPMGSA